MKTKAARALMLASAEMVDNEIVRMRGEGKAAHSALNEMQPYVSRPATVCIPPCNPMYPALQP